MARDFQPSTLEPLLEKLNVVGELANCWVPPNNQELIVLEAEWLGNNSARVVKTCNMDIVPIDTKHENCEETMYFTSMRLQTLTAS